MSGERTATGRPVLCKDSHRALDVPNAYWQVHVAGPDFNVSGGGFKKGGGGGGFNRDRGGYGNDY